MCEAVPRRQPQQRRAACRAHPPPAPASATPAPPVPQRHSTGRPVPPAEAPERPREAPAEAAQPEASLSSAGPTRSHGTAGGGRVLRKEGGREEEGTREGSGVPRTRPPGPAASASASPSRSAPRSRRSPHRPSAPARPGPAPQASSPRARPAGLCPPQRCPTVPPTPSWPHPRLLRLTGKRGAISAEQQWQKKRPGCGEASAIFPPPPRRPAPPGDAWRGRTAAERGQKGTAAETRKVGGAEVGGVASRKGAWLVGEAGPMALCGVWSRRRAAVPIPVLDLCFSSR